MLTIDNPIEKVRPTSDNVLVRLERQPRRTAGGLYLPDRDEASRRYRAVPARVLATGPGYRAKTELAAARRSRYNATSWRPEVWWDEVIPTGVEPGDRVLICVGELAGDLVTDEDTGLRMVRANEIDAIIPDEVEAE